MNFKTAYISYATNYNSFSSAMKIYIPGDDYKNYWKKTIDTLKFETVGQYRKVYQFSSSSYKMFYDFLKFYPFYPKTMTNNVEN